MTARQLQRLFARKDRLEAELRAVNRRIATEGREYARAQTGCVWLRQEAIRTLVEAELQEAA